MSIKHKSTGLSHYSSSIISYCLSNSRGFIWHSRCKTVALRLKCAEPFLILPNSALGDPLLLFQHRVSKPMNVMRPFFVTSLWQWHHSSIQAGEAISYSNNFFAFVFSQVGTCPWNHGVKRRERLFKAATWNWWISCASVLRERARPAGSRIGRKNLPPTKVNNICIPLLLWNGPKQTHYRLRHCCIQETSKKSEPADQFAQRSNRWITSMYARDQIHEASESDHKVQCTWQCEIYMLQAV